MSGRVFLCRCVTISNFGGYYNCNQSFSTMNYKKLSFPSILTVLMLIAGCKGATGPAGPSLTGNITGFVLLINSDSGVSYPADRSGVTVSVQGTSLSTMTDSRGRWTLTGLSTGIYTIVATKPGYGMTEQQGVEFTGGNGTVLLGSLSGNGTTIEYLTLAQPPNFSLMYDSLKTTDSSLNVWFSMSGPQIGAENEFLIAIGKDSGVSASDPNKYIYSTDNGAFGSGLNGFIQLNASDLYYAGLRSGMKAYLIAYPLEFYGFGNYYSSYFDIATGRFVYTSLGAPTKVIMVTIP